MPFARLLSALSLATAVATERNAVEGHDSDATSLLQTFSGETLRSSSAREVTASGEIVALKGSAETVPTPLGQLPPCTQTAGGGCQGGLGPAPEHTEKAPAPAHHFPQQQKWLAGKFPAGLGQESSNCGWQSPMRIALVHVGKSAGQSVDSMLQNAPVNFTHVHSSWANNYFDAAEFDLFIVVTRDPVARTISAYNWRHPVGGMPETTTLWPAEQAMYSCLNDSSVAQFAESLERDQTGCGWLAQRCLHSVESHCGHLAAGFRWYLQTGLHRASRSLLTAVRNSQGQKHVLAIPQENFAAGVNAMWDWLCIPSELRPSMSHEHGHYPRQHDTFLSPQGLEALQKHLLGEYYALEELDGLADEW